MRKILFLVAILALAGCRTLYPSMMLQTPRDYKFTQLPDSVTSPEYKIAANDFINFRLFANDGLRLVDFTNVGENGGGNNVATITSGIDYVVDIDGSVIMPIIGKTPVSGMTIREATKMFEQKYEAYYVHPYVLVKVNNRRIIVFPGNPGTAKVIPLVNNNTTLIEALAFAGGLTVEGKAWQIKLIRGNPNNPQVFLIDLSTIAGVKAANMVLQANDIVYVTPQRRFASAFLDRLTPVLSLITSLLLTIALLRSSTVHL